jgi:hypothetical protein
MKVIKLSIDGVPSDYASGLVPLVIQQLGYKIQWVSSSVADLLVVGPFQNPSKSIRLIPKPLRPYASIVIDALRGKRKNNPLTLFHTQENVRHNAIEADFSISFDLGVPNKNHLRLPYWMEMIDWSHEGLTESINPRYGRLLSLDRLMKPLGTDFQQRLQKMAMITSHLNEPRKMLYEHLSSFLPIDGFGPYFDKNIRSHHQSNFTKYDLLQQYAFNLCPENSIYPGYITEKIPEAFCAGCIPITWVDPNVGCDFNPLAIINVMPMVHERFSSFEEFLHSSEQLQRIAQESLIIRRPSLEPLKTFMQEILRQAYS